MVCHGTTKNWLGTRVDRPQPTPHSPQISWHHKSPVSPSPIDSALRDSHSPKGTATIIRQCPPPTLWLPWCLWTMKRKRITPITTMGSHHQPETRSPSNPHQQNHLTLTGQIAGTLPVPKRAHSMRNNTTLKKPIRCIVLLHQKEEQKTPTSLRLSFSKCVDHQELLPPATNSITNWPTTRLHPVH